MDDHLRQTSEEFRPPTVNRAIENVKALLVGTGAEREGNGAVLPRRSHLDNAILELLQAVTTEADPDPGLDACGLTFKEI